MDNLIFSLNATIPIFFTIIIGYLLRQTNMINDNFVTVVNKFNFKITLSALLFLDLYNADFYKVWNTKYVLFCFIVTLLCFIIITVLTLLFCKNKELIGEFIQSSYRGSAAVLGLAFIQNIYGSATVTPLMIIGTVPLYNILAVLVLSFTGSTNQKLDKKHLIDSLKSLITNPIIISIFLGLLASLSHIQLPFIMTKTLHNLSVMATPLALIGLGASFEGRNALKMLKPTFFATIIRLFLQCALFLPLAIHMGFQGEEMVALLVMLGAPTTSSCYIMAKNMGHNGVLTSSTVVATTFFSSISLTFWLFILKTCCVI